MPSESHPSIKTQTLNLERSGAKISFRPLEMSMKNLTIGDISIEELTLAPFEDGRKVKIKRKGRTWVVLLSNGYVQRRPEQMKNIIIAGEEDSIFECMGVAYPGPDGNPTAERSQVDDFLGPYFLVCGQEWQYVGVYLKVA